MARQLGARKLWDTYASRMGGFNLGGPPPVQSSVSTPNPASAGVSGQPAASPAPRSAGGMGVGQPRDDLDSGMTSPTAPSNANVTGFDPSLAANAATFAQGGPLGSLVGMPNLSSVIGPLGGQVAGPVGGVLGSLIGSLVQGLGKSAVIGAIPSGLTAQGSPAGPDNSAIPEGSPVTYGGKLGGPLGFMANQFGIPTGKLFANVRPNDPIDPNAPTTTGLPGEVTGIGQQGLSVAVPDVTPNQGIVGEAGPGNPTGVVGGTGGMGVGQGTDGSVDSAGDDGSGPGGVGVSGVGVSGESDGGVAAGTGGASGDAGGEAGIGEGDAGEGEGGIGGGISGPGDAGAAAAASDAGLGIGLSGLGEAAGMGTSTGADADAGVVGNEGIGLGDGGAGAGAGGAASLLCNYALDSGRCGDEKSAKKSRRDLDAIVERAFREKPGMRDSFKHYQAISGKIIAKMKALPAEAEEAAFADLQSELVEPVSKAARRGDATTVGRALRRATMKLAKEYGVDIPEEYLVASEKHVGPRADDDKTYNKPSGSIQKPSPKKLASMLEPDEAPVPEAPKPEKIAGTGGMSVGRPA